MKLNKNKTKCMLFNFAKENVSVNLTHPHTGEDLEFVKEFKILGVILTNDLSFQKNIEARTKATYKCLWTLVRLCENKIPLKQMVKIYCSQIRSILEFSILIMISSLTKTQLQAMEAVQRRATKIMLNDYLIPYHERLKLCELTTLEDRWEAMLNRFAFSFLKSNRMDHWLKPNLSSSDVQLRKNHVFLEPKYRTERYRKCTTNTIIRILNGSEKFAFSFEDQENEDHSNNG